MSFKLDKSSNEQGCGAALILCIFGVLVYAISAVGKSSVNTSGVDTNSNSTASPFESPAHNNDLVVSDLKAGKDGSITGIVTNNGSKTYGYVQVEINLFDKSHTVVGSTLANVNNLAAHEKWKFSASSFGYEGATNFEVKAVTGY
jgi:hypothetical protein